MIGWIAKSAFGAIFGEGFKMLKGWLKHKREMKEMKQEVELAMQTKRVEAEITRAMADIQQESKLIDQMSTSWKDEFWTIVLAMPLVCFFIPPMVPYVEAGFIALQAAPDWYKVAVGVAISAAFGYRKIVDMMAKRKQS